MSARRFAPVIAPVLLAHVAGCVESAPGPSGGEEIRVVTSVLPHADIVRRIGDAAVRVNVLIPPGAAPSTYEPTVRELRAVAEASLFVTVGHPAFPFERAWFDRLIAERPDVVVISGAEGAPTLSGDPHVWLSLPAVRETARRVRDELSRQRPASKVMFDENLARFLAEVDRINADLLEVTAGKDGEAFYVFHPAWGYVADAFGLKQIAIEEEGKAPAAAQLGHVIDHASASGARVIFIQPQHEPESARAVAREIGARVVPLDPLPEDWVAGMDALVAALKEALSP